MSRLAFILFLTNYLYSLLRCCSRSPIPRPPPLIDPAAAHTPPRDQSAPSRRAASRHFPSHVRGSPEKLPTFPLISPISTTPLSQTQTCQTHNASPPQFSKSLLESSSQPFRYHAAIHIRNEDVCPCLFRYCQAGQRCTLLFRLLRDLLLLLSLVCSTRGSRQACCRCQHCFNLGFIDCNEE